MKKKKTECDEATNCAVAIQCDIVTFRYLNQTQLLQMHLGY